MSKSLILVLMIISAAAHADELKIVCKQAKDIGRADSVKLVEYKIDTAKESASLGCSDKIVDGDFCGGIRMSQKDSKFLTATRLDDCKGVLNGTARTTYLFKLVQEDEFDNVVAVTIAKDCKTGKTQMNPISAVITNNNFEEVPEGAEVVSCSVTK